MMINQNQQWSFNPIYWDNHGFQWTNRIKKVQHYTVNSLLNVLPLSIYIQFKWIWFLKVIKQTICMVPI